MRKTSVAFNDAVTTCPVIDGWIRELANDAPRSSSVLSDHCCPVSFGPCVQQGSALVYSLNGSSGKGTFVELLRNLLGVNQLARLGWSGEVPSVQRIDEAVSVLLRVAKEP